MKTTLATVCGALVVLAALVSLAGAGETLGTTVKDTAITLVVKSKLVAARTGNFGSIDVDTAEGVVNLRGTVPTEADRSEAERLARGTNGVQRVVNELRVESRATTATGHESASPATDDFRGRHTVTGEVTQLDAGTGQVQLRTEEGELSLVFPPAALDGVHPGDTLTVELAVRPGA